MQPDSAGADPIAEISAAVRKVLEAPGDQVCATFEIDGEDDAWAQVMKGSLNLAYPFANPPDVADVAASLPGATVASWKAETSVTYSFESADAHAIAVAIDSLFTKFFACDDYAVNCRIEDLGA